MKHFVVALLLLNVLFLVAECKEDVAEAPVQKMQERMPSFKTLQAFNEIVLAARRGDFIWILSRAIDLYKDLIGYRLPTTDFFARILQWILRGLHRIYIRVFPNKKLTDLSVVGAVSDGINSISKGISQNIPGTISKGVNLIEKPVKAIANGIGGTVSKGISQNIPGTISKGVNLIEKPVKAIVNGIGGTLNKGIGGLFH